MYRGRSLPEVVEATPEEEEDSWEEQVVETVNNTINHMVSNTYSQQIDQLEQSEGKVLLY